MALETLVDSTMPRGAIMAPSGVGLAQVHSGDMLATLTSLLILGARSALIDLSAMESPSRVATSGPEDFMPPLKDPYSDLTIEEQDLLQRWRAMDADRKLLVTLVLKTVADSAGAPVSMVARLKAGLGDSVARFKAERSELRLNRARSSLLRQRSMLGR